MNHIDLLFFINLFDIPVIIKYSPDPSKFLLSQTFPVLFNGYGVSVGEDDKVLEMADNDGCTAM